MGEAFLEEIDRHQEECFPRTFNRVMWRKGKRVEEEVMLFGDLVDRMKARVKSGAGFCMDDWENFTLSTKTSDMTNLKHGATDFMSSGNFIRHGVQHGSSVRIETAVGSLS